MAYALFHTGFNDVTLPLHGRLPWNTHPHPHHRKFIEAPGMFRLAANGPDQRALLGVWAEYEAPSHYRWLAGPQIPGGPTHVHTLLPPHPRDRAVVDAHNTDPLIFGPHWLYSNCMQSGHYSRTLQHLAPGDVLVFGSGVGEAYVIDTVFVVADLLEYNPRLARAEMGSRVSPWVYSLVLDLVPDGHFILYTGATHLNPINGLFSYAPSAPMQTHPMGFARPAAPIPYQTRKTRGIKRLGDAHEVWEAVTEAVLMDGLALGVEFDVPDEFSRVDGGVAFIRADQLCVLGDPPLD